MKVVSASMARKIGFTAQILPSERKERRSVKDFSLDVRV